MVTNISLTNRSGLDQVKAGSRVQFRSLDPLTIKYGTVLDVSEYSTGANNQNQGRQFVKYVFMVRPDGCREVKEVTRWV